MMNNMTITCETFSEFMEAIQGCVSRGLTFTANASTLKIQLTGGF